MSADILIVANPQSRAAISYALSGAPQHFRLLSAGSERDMRQQLSEADPVAVLFDDAAPVMDRKRAMELVAEFCAGTPLVVIGRSADVDDAIRALDEGAADYVAQQNLVRLSWTIERAVRTECERRRHIEVLQNQLAASKERFQMFAETSKDWVWEIDRNIKLMYSNQAVKAILGYDPACLIGAYVPELLSEGSRKEVEAEFPKIAGTGGTFTNWRLQWLHRDKYWKTLESTGVATYDEHGKVAGYRGVSPDLTEKLKNIQKIEHVNRIHAVLSAISNIALRANSRQELLAGACDTAVREAGFKAALLAERVGDSNSFTIVARSGSHELLDAIASSPIFELHLNGRGKDHPDEVAANECREVRVFDFANCERHLAVARDMIERGIRSQVALPLGERPWGFLNLYSDKELEYDIDEIGLLHRLADEIDFGLRFLEKREQLGYLAFHHPVSGLPNRHAFLDHLGSRPANTAIVVAAVKIARLGSIASARGRAFADELLARAGASLGALGGFAAHVEGSIFLLTWEQGDTLQTEAANLDARLEDLEASGFIVGDELIHITLRAGIAPGVAGNSEELERNANSALASAIKAGQRVAEFDKVLQGRIARALDLERDLRRALEHEELELHYQPKFDATTRRLAGAEALLRWRHPREGLVSPQDFIPALEESGLIVPVGAWVMAQALRTALHWRRTYRPALRVAVNVSVRELRHKDFLEEAKRLLEPFAGNQPLDIEVTESVLMEDITRSISTLEGLRTLGCRIEIDDFGTGYSSLNYLVRLPIDAIKIDRSFVSALTQGPQAAAISGAIIELAHALGMRVTGEGVETEEQVRMLQLLRCDTLQGFLLGRPMDAEAFASQVLSGFATSSAND
ncbi:EAL domain-containing protein [Agrilutibacter solisilvae]|uniref:EAL domain-containing protein n=1 Tax=Agrilutibacter solisilvae TaxID=2763317 RepID=A0A974Y1L0_9GAMM|nr:EAL domain-containing protein [Lysobacter solisilvae]QSX79742.1 EAL domain-containing protein [Lysobacter solisilvae]